MTQTLEEKMQMFFQAIDSVTTGNDGTIRIRWKNNVVQEIPGNNLLITKGVDVSKAKEIHLNPIIQLDPDEVDILDKKLWETNDSEGVE